MSLLVNNELECPYMDANRIQTMCFIPLVAIQLDTSQLFPKSFVIRTDHFVPVSE